MAETLMFSGKTHNTSGPSGGTKSGDGLLNLKLPEAHPAAENLFGAAWSACYMAAIQFVAGQKKITIPKEISVDTEIDLLRDASGFFLRAKMAVSIPGVPRDQAQALVDAAHQTCPYSKAVHGNIKVTTTVV